MKATLIFFECIVNTLFFYAEEHSRTQPATLMIRVTEVYMNRRTFFMLLSAVLWAGFLVSCTSNQVVPDSRIGAKTEKADLAKPKVTPSAIPARIVPTPPNLSTGTISFPSLDGLQISADLYIKHNLDAPFIILSHRAGWSRGEYLEVAPKLNALGFNCMAIDLRSGKEKFGVVNQTFEAAVTAGKATLYVDALQDWQAAFDYARGHYAKGKVIIWGSSFSSSLAISIAKANAGKVDGLLCFSPGEYFDGIYGKSASAVQDAAKGLVVPTFFTSKKSEYDKDRKAIFNVIEATNKTYFVPETEGKHGSEALFSTTTENQAYWAAVIKFLAPFLENK